MKPRRSGPGGTLFQKKKEGEPKVLKEGQLGVRLDLIHLNSPNCGCFCFENDLAQCEV